MSDNTSISSFHDNCNNHCNNHINNCFNNKHKQPLSCLIELMNNYMYCGEPIPEFKRRLAYKAFTDVTGFKPANFEEIFNIIREHQNKVIKFTAFYVYLPIIIIIVIILLGLALIGSITWGGAIFGSIATIIILYIFAVGYRFHTVNFLSSRTQETLALSRGIQQNLENTIAYLPQGILSSACAITCNNLGCWKCNPVLQNANGPNGPNGQNGQNGPNGQNMQNMQNLNNQTILQRANAHPNKKKNKRKQNHKDYQEHHKNDKSEDTSINGPVDCWSLDTDGDSSSDSNDLKKLAENDDDAISSIFSSLSNDNQTSFTSSLSDKNQQNNMWL